MSAHPHFPGDISGCHSLKEATTGVIWVVARDAAKHPAGHRTATTLSHTAEKYQQTPELPKLRNLAQNLTNFSHSLQLPVLDFFKNDSSVLLSLVTGLSATLFVSGISLTNLTPCYGSKSQDRLFW